MTARDWLAKRAELEAGATEGPWNYGTPSSDSALSRGEWMTTCATDPEGPADGLWTVWIDGPIIPAITGDGPRSDFNAAFIADARSSLPAMRKALEAVLEIHQPYYIADCVCDEPGHDGGSWYCTSCDDYWPCETVNAVSDKLEPTP